LTIRIVDADKEKRKPGNKTKREESIPLNNDAHLILKQRYEANENNCHIFLNGKGNSIDNDNIYRVLIPILTRLNIKDASPHTFRHSFASHLAIKGVSLYKIKDLLRHASIRETEIYAHLSKKSTEYAVQQLNLDEIEDKKDNAKNEESE
jgi:site-specific recombinase XerD